MRMRAQSGVPRFVAGALAVLLATGCRGSASTAPNTVRLDAVAIAAPATASASAPITVDVTIGRGACSTFTRFDVARTPSSVVLTPYGIDEVPPNGACTQQLILERRSYIVQPPYTNPFTVAVRQRTDSLLTKQIAIQ